MKFKYFIFTILVFVYTILLINTTCFAEEEYTINSVEDLINFASEVNEGKSFAGETIYLMDNWATK